MNAEERRLCFGLLGPAPEHPMRDFILHGPNDLMGDDARRWQEEYRRRIAEEAQGEPEKNRGEGR